MDMSIKSIFTTGGIEVMCDRVATESEEQRAFFRMLSVELQRYPELTMSFHVPNEGKRQGRQGGRMKAEGLVRGVPDIFIDVPCGGFHGCRIELKRRKGFKISSEQKEWIHKLNNKGYAAAFCFGWEDAWTFVEAYLNSENEKQRRVVYEYIDKSLKRCV